MNTHPGTMNWFFLKLDHKITFFYYFDKKKFFDASKGPDQSENISKYASSTKKYIRERLIEAEKSESISEYISFYLAGLEESTPDFDYILSKIALKKTLLETPKIVESIAQLLKTALKAAWEVDSASNIHEFHESTIIKLLLNGIDLERYCEQYLPGSKAHFIFIDEEIKRMKSKGHLFDTETSYASHPSLIEIELSRYPTDYRQLTDHQARIKGAALVIKKAFFYQELTRTRQDHIWMNLVHELCENPITLEAVNTALIDEMNYSAEGSTCLPIETKLSLLKLSRNTYLNIDIIENEGSFQNSINIAAPFHTLLRNLLINDIPLLQSLVVIDRYNLESPDKKNQFTYEILDKQDEGTIFIVRWKLTQENGEILDLIPLNLKNIPLSAKIVEALGTAHHNNISAWITDTSAGASNELTVLLQSTLHIQNNSWTKWVRKHLKIVLKGNSSDIHQHLYENSGEETVKQGGLCSIPIGKDYLKLLYQFCPKEKIEVYGKLGSDYPSEIRLVQYDLLFHLEKCGRDTPLAISETFPGYHIAEQQYHPAIASLPHTLLLDSSYGKKKVLIDSSRSDFLPLSYITRLNAGYQPLTKIAVNNILEDNRETKGSEFYACDLEEIDGEWHLVSPDHKALGFLLVHHLYRLEFTKAEKICQQIEWIYHSQKVPEEQWPEINYLLLPKGLSPEITQYRWRLIAAREMNRCTIGTSSADSINDEQKNRLKPKQTSYRFTPYVMKIMTLIDLFGFLDNKNTKVKITLHQEYYLYKYLLNNLFNSLKGSFDVNFMIGSFKSEDIFDAFLSVAPFDTNPLIQRYSELKEKLGIPTLPHVNKLQNAIRFLLTPSSVTAFELNKKTYQAKKRIYDEPMIQSLISLMKIQAFKTNSKGDIGIDTKQLRIDIDPKIVDVLDLPSHNLISSSIKKKFLSYYSLMRGCRGFKTTSAEGSQLLSKEDFKAILLRNKGFGDLTTQRLITILLEVYENSEIFPKSIELIEAHQPSIKGLAIFVDQEKTWKEMIFKIWDKVTLQQFSRAVLMPLFGKQILLQPAASTLKGFVDNAKISSDNFTAMASNVALNTLEKESLEVINEATEKYGARFLSDHHRRHF